MHTWHWHTWNGLSYLRCSLLEQWPHGFFTQRFWPQSPAHLVHALHPQAEVYRVKQVHGNTVVSTGELASTEIQNDEESSQVMREADGLVTEAGEQAVWVCTADCTPVLIADEQTGKVAAIHAGWRGTAAKIVPQAIILMQQQGSEIHQLRIAMGPAIAGEVYQVTEEVASQVGATVTPGSETESVLPKLKDLPASPILDDPQPGRVRLDVRRTIALQLEQLGVAPEQIAIAPYCTYQSPQDFFSYRRDNLKKVQWSGIVSV